MFQILNARISKHCSRRCVSNGSSSQGLECECKMIFSDFIESGGRQNSKYFFFFIVFHKIETLKRGFTVLIYIFQANEGKIVRHGSTPEVCLSSSYFYFKFISKKSSIVERFLDFNWSVWRQRSLLKWNSGFGDAGQSRHISTVIRILLLLNFINKSLLRHFSSSNY